MARPIPERVDPWLLSEKEAVVEGDVALSALPRLAPLLSEDCGAASYRFRFGRDDKGRFIVRSLVRAELKLPCQRCLETLSLPVEAHGALALVQGPVEAEQLPEELDPLLLGEKELIQLLDLVEDELLLSIPVAPRHAMGNCQQPEAAAAKPDEEQTRIRRKSPFEVLAGLKSGDEQS